MGQARPATCNCPKTVYADTQAQATFHLANGKTIILCGDKNTRTKPVSFAEFVLFVCGQKKIIGFWESRRTCQLVVSKDTLLVNHIANLPVGKGFAYESTTWVVEKIYFSGIRVMRKVDLNRSYPRYSAAKIATVLKAFERAHSGLDDAKLTLADELFVATLSGSNQARGYLKKFETKFGVLDGYFGEDYYELMSMLQLWDKKGSWQKP